MTRTTRFEEATFDMDERGLEVRIESGTGYMRSSNDIFLHMDVLLRMLERQGYTVTKNPT